MAHTPDELTERELTDEELAELTKDDPDIATGPLDDDGEDYNPYLEDDNNG